MATMHRKGKRLLALVALLSGMVFTSACYPAHVAWGQLALLRARQPIAAVLADPELPESVRERLARVDEVRTFAEELGLDVERRYTHFAPWPGDFVVVSVVATRPGEVQPLTRWYPFVGRVPYRGYFDPRRAASQATRLRARGLDVCEVPVRAYSTLGWFDDPVTGPMVRQQEPQLVQTLFHELLHATVYVAGQADFNEGVASFVGEEARVRFYGRSEGPEAEARERSAVEYGRRLRAEILALRTAVEALYAETPPGPARAARRAELEGAARARIAALDGGAPDAAAVAAERLRLNDACLALTGTYHSDTPLMAAVLEALDGDLPAFVAAVRHAAETEAPRDALLRGVSETLAHGNSTR